MRNERSFHIKVLDQQLSICFTGKEGNRQNHYPFSSPLVCQHCQLCLFCFFLAIIYLWGLACIRVMANYQFTAHETWLIGYNMWGWIKKALDRNFVNYQKIIPLKLLESDNTRKKKTNILS
jgi:hypothetical protein